MTPIYAESSVRRPISEYYGQPGKTHKIEKLWEGVIHRETAVCFLLSHCHLKFICTVKLGVYHHHLSIAIASASVLNYRKGDLFMTSKRQYSIVSGLAFVGMLTVVAPVNASILGKSVTAVGDGLSPNSAVVGDGIEFTGIGGDIHFDFGANTLTVTASNSVRWFGFGTYFFGGLSEPITSFGLISNSGFYLGVADNFRYGPYGVSFDMSSGGAVRGATALFNITVAAAPVPEPHAWQLLGVGLLGLIAKRRRLSAARQRGKSHFPFILKVPAERQCNRKT